MDPPGPPARRLATSSSRRRPSARLRSGIPDAHLAYIVEPPPRRSSSATHISTTSSSRRGARACADCATTCALADGCAPRAYDLAIDFHGGPRELRSDLADRARRCGSATTSPAAAGCTRRVRRGRARSARAIPSRTSGICCATLGIPPPDRATYPCRRWRPTRAAAAAVDERLGRAGVTRGRPRRSSST